MALELIFLILAVVTDQRIPLLTGKTRRSHLNTLLARRRTYIQSLIKNLKPILSTPSTNQSERDGGKEE